MKLSGHILTPRGWFDGELEFDQKIINIRGKQNVPNRYIAPGFIDVHVHGGGGGDTMDGLEGLEKLAKHHAQHGTTALLATTITNPWPNIMQALKSVKTAMQNPNWQGARILGAHLEGPFINPQRLGAQPPHTLEPNLELIQAALEVGVIQVVTLAPELPNALEAARAFLNAGVRVSLGHTAATAEQANAVFELASSLKRTSQISGTHLYNAMGGLEGRNPGALGALLANPNAYGEIILDGHHVHPTSFRAAFFAKPEKLMLITDAIRASGLPDGVYDLGGQSTRLEQGAVRLEDGTLAGSVLTMIQAVQNAVKAGLALEVALKLASSHPALYLGLTTKGKISNGFDADLVVLDEASSLESVWLAGRELK
jgi:N-acetylglucosamine-6-phosphate deacetylase